MDPLVYCAQTLGYILGLAPLNEEKKKRVLMIEDINTIQKKLGKGALSPKQFDQFWDAPLDHLTQIINDNSSLLYPPLHHSF